MEKELKLLIVGSTGQLGKNVIQYLIKYLSNRNELHWGVAARSQSKLTQFLYEIQEFLNEEVIPTYLLDLNNEEALFSLVAKAEIVINCLKVDISDPLIKSCILANTIYIDGFDDKNWFETCFNKYNELAIEYGTFCLLNSGLLSFPSELGISYAKNLVSPGNLISVDSYIRFKYFSPILELSGTTWKHLVSSQKDFPLFSWRKSAKPESKRKKRIGYQKDVKNYYLNVPNHVNIRTGLLSNQLTRGNSHLCIQQSFSSPTFLRFFCFCLFFILFVILCKFWITRGIMNKISSLRHPFFYASDDSVRPLKVTIIATSLASPYVPSTISSPPIRQITVQVDFPKGFGVYGSTAICLLASALHILKNKNRLMHKYSGGFITVGCLFNNELVQEVRSFGIKTSGISKDQ